MSTKDRSNVIVSLLRGLRIESYEASRHMPKSEKHLAGQDIKRMVNDISEYFYRAIKSNNKKTILRELDSKIFVFKMTLSTIYDMCFISHRRHDDMLNLISQLGAIVGSWLNEIEK